MLSEDHAIDIRFEIDHVYPLQLYYCVECCNLCIDGVGRKTLIDHGVH